MDVLEPIGNDVVGFGDHLVCEEHINDAVNILLRNILLEDRRDVLRQRLEFSRSRLLLRFSQHFNYLFIARVVHGRELRVELN